MAIDLGNVAAMFNLGYMYQRGHGQPGNQPNYPVAIKYFEMAIRYGGGKTAEDHRKSIDKLNKQQANQLLNALWKDLLAGKLFTDKTIEDLEQCKDTIIKRLTTETPDESKKEEREYYSDSFNLDLLKNISDTKNHPIYKILKTNSFIMRSILRLFHKTDLNKLQKRYDYTKAFVDSIKARELPRGGADLITRFTFGDSANNSSTFPFFTYQEPQETGANEEVEMKYMDGKPCPPSVN